MRPPACHLTQPAALLQAQGADTRNFLQTQFSNDLRHSDGVWTYGLWLDHRGRIQGDGWVLVRADAEAWILSLHTPAAQLQAKLEAHIIADDVTLHDQGTEHALVGLWDRAEAPPPGPLPPIPGRRGEGLAWEVLLPRREADQTLATLLSGGGTALDADALRERRLQAGIPAVGVEVLPDDTPLEAGLEAEAVCLTKGCFLGQEVVNRQHHTGRATRQLRRLRLDAPAAAGAPLYLGTECVGEIRGTANHAALAMLRRRATEGATSFSLAPEAAPTAHLA